MRKYTLMAGGALVGLHWALAFLAVRSSFVGSLLKGSPHLLIKDGQVQERELRRANLSSNDLDEALRLNSRQTDPAKIRLAYLERNGSISVIPYP